MTFNDAVVGSTYYECPDNHFTSVDSEGVGRVVSALGDHRKGAVALSEGDGRTVWCPDCEKAYSGSNDVEAVMAWYNFHDPEMAPHQRAMFEGGPMEGDL